MVAAADRMAPRGLGSISEFWRDEEVLISAFLVFGREFCGTHTLGASQKALQRYQWSSLYIRDAVEIAHGENKRWLDLLRGQEPYKLRWSSGAISTHRLLLGQQRAAWMPYAGYHALRSKAKLYVRSEATPSLIKSAAGEYRAVRRRMERGMKKVRGRADSTAA